MRRSAPVDTISYSRYIVGRRNQGEEETRPGKTLDKKAVPKTEWWVWGQGD